MSTLFIILVYVAVGILVAIGVLTYCNVKHPGDSENMGHAAAAGILWPLALIFGTCLGALALVLGAFHFIINGAADRLTKVFKKDYVATNTSGEDTTPPWHP